MSCDTVGKKTEWQLWADSAAAGKSRAETLRSEGWFTVNDFVAYMEKMGKPEWTRNRARRHLNESKLKRESVYDPKDRNTCTFYHPTEKR